MRSKKNRETNIFSASVVDLFASGLGVFLIVSIIALVNQKKENQKNTSQKIDEKKEKLIPSNNVNFADTTNIEVMDKKEKESIDSQISSLDKQTYELKIAELKEELVKLRKNYKELDELNSKQLEQNIRYKSLIETLNKKIDSVVPTLQQPYETYKIGESITLKDVHFYPGTDRAIEPYASREVLGIANFLKKNPAVMVEISGHIFETKKAINQGRANDRFNLSGRRADFVCQKLVEFGINEKRFTCKGYGATRSLYLTDDQFSQEAQMNRRVEVEILSK